MTHDELIARWREANDAADQAGRAALASIRESLEGLAADAAEAAKESARGGHLKTEAGLLDRALGAALAQVTGRGRSRDPEPANGEARDEEHTVRVLAARRLEAVP